MPVKARRWLALALALALSISALEPVTAQAAETSGWIEMLEYSSIQTNGENWFTINGTNGSVSIPIQGEKRLRKVDVLIWHPTGQRPTTASCTAAGKTNTLEVLAIGGNLCRIVGYVPDAFYEVMRIDLKKSTTSSQTYEVLSWKVTPIGIQEFVADANVYLESYGTSGTYSTNYNIPLWHDANGYSSDGSPWMARIQVYDWEKYDTLSIWGSANSASIESIRAAIDTTALDIQVNYIDAEAYESSVDGDPTYWETAQWGKYLYNITIDLTGVDRSLTTSQLLVWITGSYDITVQATFNCQYVNGSVTTADTTNVSWWHRFTAFMTELFKGDSTAADDFQGEMEQMGDDFQNALDDMEEVTQPPIDEVPLDPMDFLDSAAANQAGNLFQKFFNNPMVRAMVCISVIIGLIAFIIF